MHGASASYPPVFTRRFAGARVVAFSECRAGYQVIACSDGVEGYHLLRCDPGWSCRERTFHRTADEALRRAESESAGACDRWVLMS